MIHGLAKQNMIIVSNEDIHSPLSLQYDSVERGRILSVDHLVVYFRVVVSDTDPGIFQIVFSEKHLC